MSNTNPSPQMNLPIPTTSVDAGPDYANNVNASLLLIDSHNHSSGQGVQIGVNGININGDLSFFSNNATALRSVRFSSQLAPLALGTDLGCLYESGVDLYYNDGNGNQVRITQSGNVAGTPGSIASLTSPASATYVALSATFVWQSDANTPANLDAGSIIIRDITANSKGITISAPIALAADYAISLPAALPASTKIMTMGSSGGIGVTYDVDGVTIVVSSSTIQIPSNVNLPGKAVQEAGSNVVVSNTNDTNSLCVIRGRVAIGGGIVNGVGFTCTRFSAGNYVIGFTTPFGDTPAVVPAAIVNTVPDIQAIISGGTSSTVTIVTVVSGSVADNPFNFIAIGPRA